MPWRWPKRKIVEYVTVPYFGAYSDLWEQSQYLTEVCDVSKTRVWVAENTETLRILREYADNAETPDQLKAYNKAIAVIKEHMTVGKRAHNQIATQKEYNDIQN